MTFRFWFETIVGILCFLAVLFFGEAGFSAFAIFALLPFIMRMKKVKPDERELQLFYKAGNVTLAAIIISLVILNYISGYSVNGHVLGDNWMPLSISVVMLSHGIAGLAIFSSN